MKPKRDCRSDHRIRECLEGKASTEYIIPFFWQHGEDYSVLEREMNAIQSSGISEFCVESRVHEQFGEEKWWRDMGFLLEEAKRRGMRVWLLDDKRFPTGYANNYIETHPELRAVRLRMEFRDFSGPQGDCALLAPLLEKGESLLCAGAWSRPGEEDVVCGQGISLKCENGLIWWDIPEGLWRIYYVIQGPQRADGCWKNYIDMMSAESCRAMLQGVYEPHYAHFGSYFGNTFAGFFSDEPCFANAWNYSSALGREEMQLPWNDEMPKLLAKRTGLPEEQVLLLLPALWHGIQGYTPLLREAYMETVTEAYRRNFSMMLGEWCRAHGVQYIGHVIEDQNAHQRLGYGPGHFFRALEGQDMAGCDIVLHQVIPGQTQFSHSAVLSGRRADPAFFHYTLPKLASSHAHIQPLKKGRAMCEIYGAFGWVEGLPEMKYLTDLMLVSGINYFVPHAFSPKYPDQDCPPHFYAGGTNPQFPLFRRLMEYTQRMCHVLSEGVHQADVAVYYNAEAEWTGGRCMLQQTVCKVLAQNGIDFDILPQDTICGEAWVKEGRLAVHRETYGVLLVPYSQYLPAGVLEAFGRLAREGAAIWFVDGFPEADEKLCPVENMEECFHKVSLEKVAGELKRQGFAGIRIEKIGRELAGSSEEREPIELSKAVEGRDNGEWRGLRIYRLWREELRENGTCTDEGLNACFGHEVFMLWNEDIFREIDREIYFPAKGRGMFYDAWQNMAFEASRKEGRTRVRLAPGESVILCIGPWEGELPPYDYRDGKKEELKLIWEIWTCRAGESEFTRVYQNGLGNLAREFSDFAGTIRYEALWDVKEPEDVCKLELDGVGEIAQVWVNGEYCGSGLGRMCWFDVEGKLTAGENRLRIQVISNLAYRERDMFSSYLPLPPTGLTGPVSAYHRSRP